MRASIALASCRYFLCAHTDANTLRCRNVGNNIEQPQHWNQQCSKFKSGRWSRSRQLYEPEIFRNVVTVLG